MSKTENMHNLLNRMRDAGFSYAELKQLLRIERTLQRWGEMECGDSNDYASWSIERDETTGKPFKCVYWHKGETTRTPIPDREAGALKRLQKIMASHPDFVAYHQTDCRGCQVYIVRKSDIPADAKLENCYNIGIAVCV